MSVWTRIMGTLTVSAGGATDEESEYILRTVLNHLPSFPKNVPDVEFRCYVNRRSGYNSFRDEDEFGNKSNLAEYDSIFDVPQFRSQSVYVLTVDANLRWYVLEEALRVFMKWLCRLAKRAMVREALVQLSDGMKSVLIEEHRLGGVLFDMYEMNGNWCDRLTPVRRKRTTC